MKQKYIILVVDDEPTNVFLLFKIIECQDYKVLTAGSGVEALEIMGQIKPDLVLLDLMMPRISGFEVLDQMKNNHSTKSIPVIIITAMDDSKNKEQAIHAGASAYLTKPITKKIVLDTVSHILNNKNTNHVSKF